MTATTESQKNLLIMTVGGSPQPLATALKEITPDKVIFIVSNGANSSRSQVESQEIEYDRDSKQRGKGLRFSEGCPKDIQILPIEADNVDKAYQSCFAHISALKKQFPDYKFIADYTGGTKTMTGALLMAAFAIEGIEVQFMSGTRENLQKITAGTEKAQTMSADFILAQREFVRIEKLVEVYDYSSALRQINNLIKSVSKISAPKSFKIRLENTKKFLSIFAAWDNFDHKEALNIALNSYENGEIIGEYLDKNGYFDALKKIVKSRDTKQSHWIICGDLWQNSIRTAHRKKYDDAIARLYRLNEAAVQAQLLVKYKITNPVPFNSLTPVVMTKARPKRMPNIKYDVAFLGMELLIQFLGELNPSDDMYSRLVDENDKSVNAWTLDRNNSILAHGFSSLTDGHWSRSYNWMKDRLRHFWQEHEPPQLPNKLPEF